MDMGGGQKLWDREERGRLVCTINRRGRTHNTDAGKSCHIDGFYPPVERDDFQLYYSEL